MSPTADGGHPDPAARGGRAFAVWGGAWGAVVSGDVEEGVEEEVSDAFRRVAAWTRVAARMRVLVPKVRRHSKSCSPSPRRCCRTAAGLCRA